ncbi:restriction endonuclease [Streptomyces sp. NPDC091376]|uniref:restriction endonuclease n=1 Tax=Streptomyces sp. NPDC091376 TaxID=3365994 RepID=UPI003809BC09
MIIDTNAQVTPRRYKDRDLRRMMGDLLGKASSDDVLACFLWAQEGRIGLYGYHSICDVETSLGEQLAEFQDRWSSSEGEFPFAKAEFRQAVDDLESGLYALCGQVRDLKHRAGVLFNKMRMHYGDESLTPLWLPGENRSSSLEEIGVLWDKALAAKRRAERLPQALDEALEQVRHLNDKRCLFYETGKRYTLADVDSFDHKNFEILVAWLARRDGMRAWRTGGSGDLGADVIAESPDGRRFVFQCKHTKGRRSVDSAAMQRLNGTARPIHKADVVAMVTSGEFSGPARAFANSQKIHMIGRESLKRWSEWGDSLYQVLGIEVPPPAATESA